MPQAITPSLIGAVPITHESLGARVRELRTIKRMPQDTLGKAVGVTFQQIQKYERGVNRISVVRLFEIAAALGCSVQEILQLPESEEAPRRHLYVLGQLERMQEPVRLKMLALIAACVKEV